MRNKNKRRENNGCRTANVQIPIKEEWVKTTVKLPYPVYMYLMLLKMSSGDRKKNQKIKSLSELITLAVVNHYRMPIPLVKFENT